MKFTEISRNCVIMIYVNALTLKKCGVIIKWVRDNLK